MGVCLWKGKTKLHKAAARGDLNKCQQLLERGDSVNQRGRHEDTALHFAAQSGHVEIWRLLLARGALMEAAAQESYAPLSWVHSQTPLHWAARVGQLEVCRLLMERGALVDVQSYDARTPLHFAAECGHVEVCRVLIEQGASLAVQSAAGETPLHMAARSSQLELCRLLIKKEALVETPGNRRTPLQSAAQNGHLEAVGCWCRTVLLSAMVSITLALHPSQPVPMRSCFDDC